MRVKLEEDKKEVLEKLNEVAENAKRESVMAEIRNEKIVRAIKDEGRARRYTRDVRRSVEELDNATGRKTTTERYTTGRYTFSKRSAEEEYRAEEARIVDTLRKDDANLEAIREMSKKVRSRRKMRPEAPRPLVRQEVQVVTVDEDISDGVKEVVEVE